MTEISGITPKLSIKSYFLRKLRIFFTSNDFRFSIRKFDTAFVSGSDSGFGPE